MNARPDCIGAILLATRTEREDRGFLVAPEKNMAPEERVLADRTWFELDRTPGTGYARVITLRTEVETPNMFRGQ